MKYIGSGPQIPGFGGAEKRKASRPATPVNPKMAEIQHCQEIVKQLVYLQQMSQATSRTQNCSRILGKCINDILKYQQKVIQK